MASAVTGGGRGRRVVLMGAAFRVQSDSGPFAWRFHSTIRPSRRGSHPRVRPGDCNCTSWVTNDAGNAALTARANQTRHQPRRSARSSARTVSSASSRWIPTTARQCYPLPLHRRRARREARSACSVNPSPEPSVDQRGDPGRLRRRAVELPVVATRVLCRGRPAGGLKSWKTVANGARRRKAAGSLRATAARTSGAPTTAHLSAGGLLQLAGDDDGMPVAEPLGTHHRHQLHPARRSGSPRATHAPGRRHCRRPC